MQVLSCRMNLNHDLVLMHMHMHAGALVPDESQPRSRAGQDLGVPRPRARLH